MKDFDSYTIINEIYQENVNWVAEIKNKLDMGYAP
jgi:hypothetical protein